MVGQLIKRLCLEAQAIHLFLMAPMGGAIFWKTQKYENSCQNLQARVGVIKIVIVINCNLITFFKIIENNCNSVFTLITIIEM